MSSPQQESHALSAAGMCLPCDSLPLLCEAPALFFLGRDHASLMSRDACKQHVTTPRMLQTLAHSSSGSCEDHVIFSGCRRFRAEQPRQEVDNGDLFQGF